MILDITPMMIKFIWVVNLLQFMLLSSITTAQESAAPRPPPPPPDQSPFNSNYTQYVCFMALILVCAFLTFGFFSMYCRRRVSDTPGVDDGVLRIGGPPTVARGLDSKVTETFPTFVYSYVKKEMNGGDLLECAVCLNEFDDGETLRLIPKCNHAFHLHCIDVWLSSHTTCPVCRANLDVEISSKMTHLLSRAPEPDEPDRVRNEPQGQVTSISSRDLGEMNSSGPTFSRTYNESLERV